MPLAQTESLDYYYKTGEERKQIFKNITKLSRSSLFFKVISSGMGLFKVHFKSQVLVHHPHSKCLMAAMWATILDNADTGHRHGKFSWSQRSMWSVYSLYFSSHVFGVFTDLLSLFRL